MKSFVENIGLNNLEDKLCVDNSYNTLSASIEYFAPLNAEITAFNDELYNKNVSKLIYKLANAIDKNAVDEIRYLKKEYSDSEDFALAIKYLNIQCKKVWSVFDNNKKIPHEALKLLGISNCPDLDSLLEPSLNLCETNDSTTTVKVIKFILNNPNMDYTIRDILNYLDKKYKQNGYKYNNNTLLFILKNKNYDMTELAKFGADKATQIFIFKSLSLIEKCKCLFNFLRNFQLFIKTYFICNINIC